jgi:hypothetical protein
MVIDNYRFTKKLHWFYIIADLHFNKFLISEIPRDTSWSQSASFDALCVQSGSLVWSVGRVTEKGKVT